MAGSSSIQGDQTVTFTDNMSFDGTDRGGAMVADGQLWIGATASNRSDNGGHVRLGTLTAGTGMVVTNGAGTITLSTTASLTDLHTARFIVASSTLGTGANFTTIAAAIAAAQGTGINSTIFIQPGTYTENLTLVPGINICAFDCDSTTPNVTIVGTLSLSAAGSVTLSGLRLKTNGAAAVSITGTLASKIYIYNCDLNFTNAVGLTNTSSSASATIGCYYCTGDIGATGGLITSTGGNSNSFSYCTIGNSGLSTTASTCSAGSFQLGYSQVASPFSISGTGTIGSNFSTINCLDINTAAVTTAGTGATYAFTDCRFLSGTASALSIGAGTTVALNDCNVFSTNTNAITGAGTVVLGKILFPSSATSLVNTTTQNLTVNNPGAVRTVAPAGDYTVLSSDMVVLASSAAARAIALNASPSTGQMVTIKDRTGTAAANNITITPNAGNIDGSGTFVINTNYGSVTLVYNSQWYVI